ncbi:MAG: isoprenylcysteine carboxylmethyltransferase family protein [Fimbriimonadaceae bacterium]|nr:isoprenylcysteine carboxylmethyltransferase family protein [Fimbriimonadaceae bacterium]
MSFDPMRFFRPARDDSIRRNAVCTFLQTAFMWGIFLAVLPAGVLELQEALGIPRFEPGPWAWAAFALFWLAGLTGIYCGSLFVRFGAGTPFPLDETTRLVIAGPYRWVRNPMAILGIFQGVMVGVWLGSWPVVMYAVCGVFAWHMLARPFEERDLERRFGAEFTEYRDAVRNWIPSARPYRKVMGAREPGLSQAEGPVADAR